MFVPAPAFSIQYPLFALKRGGTQYAGYTMPDGATMGIPVFTSMVNLTAFQEKTGCLGHVKEFDRVAVFRAFLRSIRDDGTFVLFDLLPDEIGNLRTAHSYPAAVVLERFLPEPGNLLWSYPVYVLTCRGGYVCVDGEINGSPAKMLVVLTDRDMADRAAVWAEGSVPVAIPDRRAFAEFLRNQAADVPGAVFDPPPACRSGTKATAMMRDLLLRSLSIEI